MAYRRSRGNQTQTLDLLNCEPLQGRRGEFDDELRVELAGDSKQLAHYKGLVGTYHYLGYQQAAGAQLKYIAYFQDRPIACLSFGPAAWKISPRDQFIGWSA